MPGAAKRTVRGASLSGPFAVIQGVLLFRSKALKSNDFDQPAGGCPRVSGCLQWQALHFRRSFCRTAATPNPPSSQNLRNCPFVKVLPSVFKSLRVMPLKGGNRRSPRSLRGLSPGFPPMRPVWLGPWRCPPPGARRSPVPLRSRSWFGCAPHIPHRWRRRWLSRCSPR